jgi:hypothetical protein
MMSDFSAEAEAIKKENGRPDDLHLDINRLEYQ